MQFAKLQRSLTLEYCSLLFITLPYLIFFIGWLNPTIATAAIIILLLSINRTLIYYHQTQLPSSVQTTNAKIIKIIIIISIVATWVYLSGSGGFYLQNGDYEKHNSILNDLSTLKWPVSYRGHESFKSIYYLSYYFAYYLPAALIGKMFGVAIASKALFAWTLTGCLLTVLWIFKLTKKISILAIIIFIFFSGLDILGFLFIKNPPLSASSHIEWWSGYGFWQFSSITASLFWVPQHALSTWIITSMFLDILKRPNNTNTTPSIFLFALSSLWSPFVMIGLLPILSYTYIIKGLKKAISVENILGGGIILLISALFFFANILKHKSGFIWSFHSSFTTLATRYLQFCFLEFLIFGLLIYPWIRTTERNNQKLFYTTIISLFLIPLYLMGYYNDFAMRVSLPSIFILLIFSLQFLLSKTPKLTYKFIKIALLLSLSIGGVTAFTEIYRGALFKNRAFGYANIPKMSLPHITIQYFADSQSLFYKFLAKEGDPKISVPLSVLKQLHQE